MATADSDTRRSSRAANGRIQVIARVAQILWALRDEPGGMTLSQLSQRVGLPRSTVHRIVMSLVSEEFVVPVSPTGRFRLGPALQRLVEPGPSDSWRVVEPYMRVLFDALEETVDCAIRDGNELRFVSQIPAKKLFRAVSEVGATFPLYCTANGKAILAEMNDAEVAGLLPERLPQPTSNAHATRDGLIAELREIRKTGVAFDREEHSPGISAGGIALRVHGLLVALSVPMPTQRFVGREPEIRRVLQRIRREASAAIGVA